MVEYNSLYDRTKEKFEEVCGNGAEVISAWERF